MSVLGFEAEWFDQVSGILQTLYLKFFLDNNTIELLHNNSIFLKQIYYPDVTLQDLYIGNSVTMLVYFFYLFDLNNRDQLIP